MINHWQHGDAAVACVAGEFANEWPLDAYTEAGIARLAIGALLRAGWTLTPPTSGALTTVNPSLWLQDLIADRDRARAVKDWDRSDLLRDQAAERGIRLEDTPNGTIWQVIR